MLWKHAFILRFKWEIDINETLIDEYCRISFFRTHYNTLIIYQMAQQQKNQMQVMLIDKS